MNKIQFLTIIACLSFGMCLGQFFTDHEIRKRITALESQLAELRQYRADRIVSALPEQDPRPSLTVPLP